MEMWIVDFLISNRDRHGQNWGFYYDTETMEILGCRPLFDHYQSRFYHGQAVSKFL